MGILGNMELLSFLSRDLTSFGYQDGYCGCGGSQQYHYGMFAVNKLSFVSPKFRLRRGKKMEKKTGSPSKIAQSIIIT